MVPPLDGFWWQDDVAGVDYSDRSTFHWISVIRLPDFVPQNDFHWAVQAAGKKKELDCSSRSSKMVYVCRSCILAPLRTNLKQPL